MRMAILLAGVALLSGCGGDDAREDEDGGGGDNAPRLAGPLVYGRGGGFSGAVSEIRLRPDGRATFEAEGIGERQVKLSPAELEEVERDLARVDLAKLPAKTVDPEPDPDTFVHEVTYQGETVYTEDGADEPEELSALTAGLSALVNRYAPQRRP